jgi:hypothetical protein
MLITTLFTLFHSRYILQILFIEQNKKAKNIEHDQHSAHALTGLTSTQHTVQPKLMIYLQKQES